MVFSGHEESLSERVRALATNGRVILGLWATRRREVHPGGMACRSFSAEKSRLVSMDGFHLRTLSSGARSAERKGASETFDADGYAALLTRLRQAEPVVYAPGYDRANEEPIAATVAVDARFPW